MTDLLESLTNRIPVNLKEFRTQILAEPLEKWNSGPSFISRSIQCACGSDTFSALGIKQVEVKGFFKKREITTINAPI